MGDNPTGSDAEPGFGDAIAGAALPDMRDTPPTFEDSYGDSTQQATNASGIERGSVTAGDAESAITQVDSSYDNGGTSARGTRAEGGLEDSFETGFEGSMGSAEGPLTPAEQVAVLDRQLEQSTSDFDVMILEEQQRQREMDRNRPERTQREQTTGVGAVTGGRNPYQDDVARGSSGGGMGGGYGGSGGAPENPAIYEAPDDIPNGDNDDVVARQLREAAMREPNPAVRERLWNEYRKYTGLEIPTP